MATQSRQQTVADPWQDKADRYWLIVALVFLSYFVFMAYDGKSFYTQYLKLCSEKPERVECKPLNLVKEERQPDLGITLDYGKGKWALGVGLKKQDEAQANDLTTRLRSSGIEPRVIKIPGRGKRTWYEVQIGRFPNRKGATEAGRQLQGKGLIQDVRLVEYQAIR